MSTEGHYFPMHRSYIQKIYQACYIMLVSNYHTPFSSRVTETFKLVKITFCLGHQEVGRNSDTINLAAFAMRWSDTGGTILRNWCHFPVPFNHYRNSITLFFSLVAPFIAKTHSTDRVRGANGGPGSQFSEIKTKCVVRQTHNQGLCLLFLMVSWDLHT